MEPMRRSSTLDNILKMFGLSNTPTVPLSDDEVVGDVDEPPDHVAEMKTDFVKHPNYTRSTRPNSNIRRESLLTQAIMGTSESHDTSILSSRILPTTRALSTTSSLSVPSTAELTSDGDLTSPARSASPSPPIPTNHFPTNMHLKAPMMTNKVIIAPVVKDDKPTIVDAREAAVEKSLGRKRCIMFACSEKSPVTTKEPSPTSPIQQEVKAEPPVRKCRLTFACPTRQDSDDKSSISKQETRAKRISSPAPISPRTKSAIVPELAVADKASEEALNNNQKSVPMFHEFSKSEDETDAWVDDPIPNKPRLTIDDCMKKENAIRKIAKEAEEEADEEERELEELENEDGEEQDVEDDFAPSDEDDASDGGNESDDENGFAASDDESDDGSEYLFWAPSTATTVATNTDNLTHISSRQRSLGSSISSNQSHDFDNHRKTMSRRGKISKAIRMRPGTPELPDSTDFVCGTLDEDRPLEAAYISCREMRKREKHVPIPQDIDPSFPTTDPEDEEDEDEEDDEFAEESAQPDWLHQQFGSMESDERGRRVSAIKISPQLTPKVARIEPIRPHITRRPTTGRSPPPLRHRSPPPPKHRSPPPPKHRSSPPSRRLFGGQSPTRARSPAPHIRLNSPRGSPTNIKMPLGITITRLAQRPNTNRTASLPHTPNPFFRNWKNGSPVTSRIPSGAVTPGVDKDEPRPDLHVRGPVDIVIGLEKKRQKRKEKFWRQHCRKAAKEQSERKCTPGRGVERMKELGLESAERTRGYGIGQQAELVLSL